MKHKWKKKMKKKICRVLLFISMVPCVLCACEKQPGGTEGAAEVPGAPGDVVFLEDYRFVNTSFLEDCADTARDRDFAFSLDYVFQGDMPEIEFVTFDNKTANDCFIRMIEDTADPMEQEPYQGYRLGRKVFMFRLSSMKDGSELTVNEITLSVNGEKRKIAADGNIVCRYFRQEEERYQSETVAGISVADDDTGSLRRRFKNPVFFRSKAEAVLDQLKYTDFITVVEADVYRVMVSEENEILSAERLGTMEDVFPLELEAGEIICIDQRRLDFGECGKTYGDMACYQTEGNLFWHNEKEGQKIVSYPYMNTAEYTRNELINQALVNAGRIENDIIFLNDRISCNFETNDSSFVLGLQMLCKDCEPHIAWQELDSPLPEADRFLQSAYFEDEGNDIEYNGYRLRELRMEFDFSQLEEGKTFDIRSIKILVGGKEQSLDLSDRFRITGKKQDHTYVMFDGASRTTYPLQGGMKSMVYSYRAQEDCVIEEFGFEEDILEIVQSGVTVGSKVQGSMEEVFPLKLKKGDYLRLDLEVRLGKGDPYTHYEGSTFLRYSGGGKQFSDKDRFRVVPYEPGNEKAVTEYLKHMCKEE